MIAAYMHPSCESIKIVRNSLGLSSANTMNFLMMSYPDKMKGVDFDSSIEVGNFT